MSKLRHAGALSRLALILLLTGTAWACRYSVRDVAFVDLDHDPYQLVCFVDERTPAAYQDALRVAGVTLFFEANVRLEVVSIDTVPPHPARKFLQSRSNRTVPQALLISPEERSFPVPLPPVHETEPDAFWPFLEAVISSPKRDRMLRRLTEAFAVILLVEGADSAETEAARRAAEGAISEMIPLLPRLPKPVRTPPELLVIQAGEIEREAVWLWSLGLDVSNPRDDQVAVLHGRGRRLGPALTGGLITRTALQEMLAVNGQDCECELDRTWMRGPVIPSSWGEELQQLSFKELGFDPENPAVKTEISRILSRGPNASAGEGLASSARFDEILLGYSEEMSGAYFEEWPDTMPDTGPEADPVIESEAAAASSPAQLEEDSPSTLALAPALAAALGLLVAALLGGGWVLFRGRRND